jgi:monoamine oxidase
MSRSLFSLLHRTFGVRLSGRDRVLRAEAHRRALGADMPFGLLTRGISATGGAEKRVAVVGGGFAGLAAARALQNLRFNVTLYEATRRFGGRVHTLRSFVANRTLERGAELIGMNHPAWIELALDLGLGLSVLTTEDEHVGARLRPSVRFFGRELTPAEMAALHALVLTARADLVRQMNTAFPAGRDPYNPWNAVDAGRLDRMTVDQWITGFTTNRLLVAALRFEFGNHNACATTQQSMLALLAQIKAGGGEASWEETEVYRCEDGNDRLALNLAARLITSTPRPVFLQSETVEAIRIDGSQVEVTSAASNGRGIPTTPSLRPRVERYDYLVLAVPPTIYPRMRLEGPLRVIPRIQTGPAVKYLAETQRRYWIRQRPRETVGWAPSGTSDSVGQLWEGTDNQAGSNGIDLTVFAGGPWAAVPSAPGAHFDRGIEELLPGFGGSFVRNFEFADWPHEPFIETGYCFPAPTQVITFLLWSQQAFGGRVFLAGEHVSPCLFGYMEGALQSGIAAAGRIGLAERVVVPASVGTLTGGGVTLRTPATPP